MAYAACMIPLNPAGDFVREMQEADDITLMLRFQRHGDFAAFEQLFRRHRDPLLRFVSTLAADRAVAEDVSQRSWLKVIDVAQRRAFAERSGVGFRTWLCTLARNQFIDEYKRKFAATRMVPLPEDLHEAGAQDHDPAPDPAEIVHRHELSRHLNAALGELPFEQREVIAMWATGIELEAIVAIVGAPRDTVLSRKKYAIAKLRAALGALEYRT
jgi:RNA polymerase sigma-70 factor (ECF subfamily)